MIREIFFIRIEMNKKCFLTLNTKIHFLIKEYLYIIITYIDIYYIRLSKPIEICFDYNYYVMNLGNNIFLPIKY